MQRMETDAAASRRIDRVGQQMVDIDQPTGQQDQPRTEPALWIPDGRDEPRHKHVQQQVDGGVGLQRSQGVGQGLHGGVEGNVEADIFADCYRPVLWMVYIICIMRT